MNSLLAAFVSGVVFAVGLLVSGMSKPSKVLGFLDIAADWDPSLGFVMGGGVAVHVVLRKLILRRQAPVFAGAFVAPAADVIDRRLVLGAVLFGVGWGIAGFCPGPALTALAQGGDALAFGCAMLSGMWVHDRYLKR